MLNRDRTLGVWLVVVAAVSMTMDPISTLTPAFGTTFFHKPDTFAGTLIGAFGLGAVVASVVPFHDTDAPSQRIAAMLSILAASMIAFGLLPTLAPSLVVLAVGGFGYLIGQTSATTQLHLSVADQERGRVMALWSIAFLGTRPIAALVDGALASIVGPPAATITMAVPTIVAVVLVLRVSPSRDDRPRVALTA